MLLAMVSADKFHFDASMVCSEPQPENMLLAMVSADKFHPEVSSVRRLVHR